MRREKTKNKHWIFFENQDCDTDYFTGWTGTEMMSAIRSLMYLLTLGHVFESSNGCATFWMNKCSHIWTEWEKCQVLTWNSKQSQSIGLFIPNQVERTLPNTMEENWAKIAQVLRSYEIHPTVLAACQFKSLVQVQPGRSCRFAYEGWRRAEGSQFTGCRKCG